MNIAITGGIGAGKSTLIQGFQSAFPAARFFSMDAFVDALYQDPAWNAWLMERFGTVDRTELSRRVFANRAVRESLNAQSALKIGVSLGRVLADRSAVNVVEFPLLFETGLQAEFDYCVLITADTPTHISRVVARGKKTAEQAAAVIAAQMPEDRKAALAHVVIDTSDSDQRQAHVERLVNHLRPRMISKDPLA